MIQGPGIVDIEDLDQETYALMASLDMIERPLFEAQPDAPMNVIMYYTFTLDQHRQDKPIFDLD